MVRHNFTLKLYFSDATFDERKCKKYLKILCFRQQNSFFLHISNIKPEIQVHVHIFFLLYLSFTEKSLLHFYLVTY